MSGYNRFEQSVGNILTRFPRLKSAIEAGYQRANYHLFADRKFEYKLHDSAEMISAGEQYGDGPQTKDQFVGFYDVSPWNESIDSYFVHQIEDDTASIVVFSEGSKRIIAETQAWNYQQGSRTQWHPTEDRTLLYNDIEDGSPVSRVVKIDGTVTQTYSHPIQAVNPNGEEFLSISYRRLDRNSPGYGYGTDKGDDIPDPSADGIICIGFDGTSKLLIPFLELIDDSEADVLHDQHYIHHALYAPDGERFVFLHRWMDGENRNTRLCICDREGNWQLLHKNRDISHFSWLDNERLFMWGGSEEFGRGYHILSTTTGEVEYITALDGYGDGHPSVSPDGEWIVTDTYPNRLRKRTLTLYHLDTEREIRLGEFLAPFGFEGECRCDLHPRWSPNGRVISVDSTHTELRNGYIIDISDII